jgi:hypothetical protein
VKIEEYSPAADAEIRPGDIIEEKLFSHFLFIITKIYSLKRTKFFVI